MASATAASNARPQAWSPDPFTRSPSPYGFSSGVMPASMAQASVLSPDSVSINKGAAAALAVTAPALAALARRLVAGKTRVSEEAGGVYEVSSEDLARWLVDVAAAVGTEGKAAVATEASVAAWERAQLAGFADELEGQVGRGRTRPFWGVCDGGVVCWCCCVAMSECCGLHSPSVAQMSFRNVSICTEPCSANRLVWVVNCIAACMSSQPLHLHATCHANHLPRAITGAGLGGGPRRIYPPPRHTSGHPGCG